MSGLRRLPFRAAAVVACPLLVCSLLRPAAAITLSFDYRYDGGFFTDPNVHPQADAAKAALEHAAKSFERYLDHLAAIEPGGSNTWRAQFTRPDNGREVEVPNLVVPADTLVIFVGGRVMEEGVLGVGGPGGLWVSGGSVWQDTVFYRDQYGARHPTDPTDFGPWGGSAAFNLDVNWSFSIDEDPPEEQYDFLSAATHELAHVLGIGTADSWCWTYTQWDVGGWVFTGPASVAVYDGNVPLDYDYGHWAEGVESTVAGETQTPLMCPIFGNGSRLRLTVLDRAGLEDVGWAEPLGGDADHDGDVDFFDYVTTKGNFGTLGSWMEGDFDFDGDIDFFDYLTAKGNFGQSVEGATASVIRAAPEPASVAMLASAAAAVMLRRRRAIAGQIRRRGNGRRA